jgi:hypothetical protein
VICSWAVVGKMLQVLLALQVSPCAEPTPMQPHFPVLQCLVFPRSLRHSRSQFMAGMDLLLYVRSLGSLSASERTAAAEAEWDAQFARGAR